MFLKISKEDFSWSRSKRALPIFFIFWGTGIFLALVYLFIMRVHLQALDRNKTVQLLDGYLARHRSAGNPFVGFRPKGGSLLQGLTFIRIIDGSDQVFLVDNRTGFDSLQGLVDLAPTVSGVWLKIAIGQERKVFTVITRDYNERVAIQAGKESVEGYRLYRKLVRYTLFVTFAGCVILWPVALLFIKLSLSPLIATKARINRLLHGETKGVLPESGNGPELDSLYGQINQLLRHNRHLVFEMQNSLDNVAHDLRTPMTRLRSVAEYGLQAEDDPKRLKEVLSDCLEESERVLAMLNIMMTVAEAESGTMRLELQECDLVKSIEQVIVLYEYIAEERDIRVTMDNDSILSAHVDITRIAQVWANLLDNAIKYGRDGGWVKIGVKATAETVVVSFADNGMGISANELNRIWDRLYRGDRSRSQKGLGLGLNYVKAVVEAHGGTISVVSRLHEGSCFTVNLPRYQVRTHEKSQTSGE